MGRRGPLPRPDRTRNDRVAVVPLRGRAEALAPAPPRDLLAITKRRWRAYFASEVALALSEVDLAAVDRLFRYYDAWQRAVSTAPPGELPVGRLAALERVIGPLETGLGLTPSARARLGISIGQARRLTLSDLKASLGA